MAKKFVRTNAFGQRSRKGTLRNNSISSKQAHTTGGEAYTSQKIGFLGNEDNPITVATLGKNFTEIITKIPGLENRRVSLSVGIQQLIILNKKFTITNVTAAQLLVRELGRDRIIQFLNEEIKLII